MAQFTMTELTMTEAMSLCKDVYLACGGAVMLRGAPGTAKSKMSLALIKRLQNGVADFGGCYANLANMESIDMRGLPQIDSDDPRSRYGIPPWLQAVPADGLRGAYPALCPEHLRPVVAGKTIPDRLQAVYNNAAGEIATRSFTPYTNGIAIFDEALQAQDDSALLPLAQFADEGRIGEWGVNREGWLRLLLTNRSHDNAGARELHAHTRNRMAIFDVRLVYDDVVEFWHGTGMREEFRHYAGAEPQHVFSQAVPQDQAQFSTARAWEYASVDVHRFMRNVLKVDPKVAAIPGSIVSGQDAYSNEAVRMTKALICARVGEATTLGFFAFLADYGNRPEYKEIIDDPMEAKIATQPSVIYSTMEMLVDRYHVDHLEAQSRYLRRQGMPKVMAATWAVRMCQRFGGSIIRQKKFMDVVDHAGASAKIMIYNSAF